MFPQSTLVIVRRMLTTTTTTTDERVPEISDADFENFSYRRFRELRRASPLLKSTSTALTWAVTRHADVSTLLRDRRIGHRLPRTYLEFALGTGAAADFQEHSLLNRDGPDHTRLRRLMGQAFSAFLMRRLADHIGDLVDGLLEPLLDRATFDVIDDLAFPLPTTVICELLGVDGCDREAVRDRTLDAVHRDPRISDPAIAWFRGYMGAVLAERTPDPDGDLFQRMLAAEDGEDALTHEEIVDNALLLFVAGFETTRNLIGNGMAALLEFPDQRDRLLGDPTLARTAVEEFLRYDGPVPAVTRITLEPVEIGGRVIREHRVLMMLLASANHDEAVFEAPDRLDIGRDPNPHLAFAGGVHFCLGAQLARIEGQVVFQRIASRIASFEGAGPRAHRQGVLIRGFDHVPITATPG